MNREDILRMAREAGIRIASPTDTIDPRNVYLHELERFAELVAAAERRECALACEGVEQATESQSWVVANCVEDILARGRK